MLKNILLKWQLKESFWRWCSSYVQKADGCYAYVYFLISSVIAELTWPVKPLPKTLMYLIMRLISRWQIWFLKIKFLNYWCLNDILSKGFDSHHFVSGLASHFRDLLVSKTPSTLSLLKLENKLKNVRTQAQKCSQDFKGILYCKWLRFKIQAESKSATTRWTMPYAISLYHFDGEKKSWVLHNSPLF
jgi:hypothetical protein